MTSWQWPDVVPDGVLWREPFLEQGPGPGTVRPLNASALAQDCAHQIGQVRAEVIFVERFKTVERLVRPG